MTPLSLRCALLSKPYPCTSADQKVPGVRMHLRDVAGLCADDLNAQFMGWPATAWLREHYTDLIPGRCIDIDISQLRIHRKELEAQVITARLAPMAPSRVAAQAKPHLPTATTTKETL